MIRFQGKHEKYFKKEKTCQQENRERSSHQIHYREGTQAWVRAFAEFARYVTELNCWQKNLLKQLEDAKSLCGIILGHKESP
jgi:hypothetical protein